VFVAAQWVEENPVRVFEPWHVAEWHVAQRLSRQSLEAHDEDELTYELSGDSQASLLRGLLFLRIGNSGFAGLKVTARRVS